MREAVALVRASWLTATSYRLNMAFSVIALLVTILPLYFVAEALQPIMGKAISSEGRHYFGFLIVGTVAFSLLSTAVTALPGAVGSGIRSGTLEALLATPAGLPAVLGGLIGYNILWTALRALLLIAFGLLLGVQVDWGNVLLASGIVAMIVLAYLPVGLGAAALILAFRTTGPLPQGVLIASGMLGGVYYPTHVIPSWIEGVSYAIPLTYGLRALRRTLLDGVPFAAVAADLAILAAFILVLSAAGAAAFGMAIRYARRSGTLAQY